MKIKDIKKKSVADREKLLKERREALSFFRFSVAGSKTKNVKEGRTIRKDIARLLTVLREDVKKAKV
jgi:ribosomal protein L29